MTNASINDNPNFVTALIHVKAGDLIRFITLVPFFDKNIRGKAKNEEFTGVSNQDLFLVLEVRRHSSLGQPLRVLLCSKGNIISVVDPFAKIELISRPAKIDSQTCSSCLASTC